jgi:hypothetical protein
MSNNATVLCISLAVALCSDAFAVTGNTTITADGNSFQYGLTGVAATPTLSDGKNLVSLFEINAKKTRPGMPGLHYVEIAIGSFTSDPGRDYINDVYISCAAAPTTYKSATANYTWASATGNAIWTWVLLPAEVCMSADHGSAYSLSLD